MDNINKTQENVGQEEIEKGITREELIEQFDAQVDYLDKLPPHHKFSPATNADLCYFMLLILNILKKTSK